ncbi:unnamed protein product [Ceutorhynchus assimilis]|uniref:Uncharacterized protein n=1 Tax=Ceutorhynchus assimilis TaxID=467358 RepID=A0A9N9QKH6_9CUCU|nr:unnamed protein product [Ceutorhynchus assimilis]
MLKEVKCSVPAVTGVISFYVSKDCTNISASEADALCVINRVVVFYCSGCRSSFEEIDHLLKRFYEQTVELDQKNIYFNTLENEMEELKIAFKQEIERLVNLNHIKDNHIEKLERRTQNIDEEVLEAEKSYEATLRAQKLELTRLNGELLELLKKNNIITDKLNSQVLKLDFQENELLHLKVINKSLNDNILSLSKKNDAYVSERRSSN